MKTMSIFGNNGTNYDVPVNESYTIYDGDIVAIEEATQDMEGVIESIHAHDMTEIQRDREIKALEERDARDYEIARVRESYESIMEGFIKDTWERMKKLVRDLWAKLKGYFANLVRFADGFFLSGKKFVEKYENQLTSLSLSGYKYTMYNWNNAELNKPANVTDYPEKMKTIIKNSLSIKDGKVVLADKNTITNKMRGLFVGGSVTAENYQEELFKKFRNGATNKDDRKEVSVNIGEMIKALKSDEQLKTVKALSKKVDDSFNKVIGELDSAAKEYKSKKDASSALVSFHQKRISLIKEGHSIALAYVKAWKNAYVQRNKEYKGACVAAFRYKEK